MPKITKIQIWIWNLKESKTNSAFHKTSCSNVSLFVFAFNCGSRCCNYKPKVEFYFFTKMMKISNRELILF